MTDSSKRDVEFLDQSNAIEGIFNISYSDSGAAQKSAGHARAYFEAKEHGEERALLTLDVICRWQRWILDEQVQHAPGLPPGGAGGIRSPRYPHNVIVGFHIAPSFELVPALMDNMLSDLNARIASTAAMSDDVDAADMLGEYFQRFEAIHPFVDGNGRIGRLIATYIAAACGLPPIVFRLAERPLFYEAHRSKMAMRVFMADKVREAIYWRGRVILERQAIGTFADIYSGVVVERHALLEKRREWADADASRSETRLKRDNE